MYSLIREHIADIEASSRIEWSLVDGRGGFAMGTAAGIATRRYHGLLFAANPKTLERTLLLAAIDVVAEFNGASYPLSSNQYPGAVFPDGHKWLDQFDCNDRYIEWTFKIDEVQIRRRIEFSSDGSVLRQTWFNDSERPIRLVLRPLTASRSYHGNFKESANYPEALEFESDETVIRHDGNVLWLRHADAYRAPVEGWYYRFEHVREAERGLDPRDDLYCPCELAYVLMPHESAILDAGATELGNDFVFEPSAIGNDDPLLVAASRYLIQMGDRKTIIAGYPWFTDWGRDAMISLPGNCLATGNVATARDILRGYSGQMSQGMIPNRIVEHGDSEYNSVDSTLWFVVAIYRTLQSEWDQDFAAEIFKSLTEIYTWHVKGTRYGIKVDPKDGLLDQGEPGVQLTWMDAKIGDWVVTPRGGKPIEIAALWINATRIIEWLAQKLGQSAEKYRASAEKAEANFEKRFWRKRLGYYLDTADPDDASLRPNQVIAMALPFSAFDPQNAATALERVEAELLTPRGLRTLAPSDLNYKGRFEGPLNKLDAAYHQGTVWPWLLGSYATAVHRFTGDAEKALASLEYADSMLSEYGLGGIAEVYDGDEPQRPNGCPWQAWSVAEILRAQTEINGAK